MGKRTLTVTRIPYQKLANTYGPTIVVVLLIRDGQASGPRRANNINLEDRNLLKIKESRLLLSIFPKQ